MEFVFEDCSFTSFNKPWANPTKIENEFGRKVTQHPLSTRQQRLTYNVPKEFVWTNGMQTNERELDSVETEVQHIVIGVQKVTVINTKEDSLLKIFPGCYNSST